MIHKIIPCLFPFFERWLYRLSDSYLEAHLLTTLGMFLAACAEAAGEVVPVEHILVVVIASRRAQAPSGDAWLASVPAADPGSRKSQIEVEFGRSAVQRRTEYTAP